jgi:paraquat-inducible protein A
MTGAAHPIIAESELESYIACPSCDALLRDRNVGANDIASCPRCHSVIEAPRPLAMTRIIMLAFAALILLVGALFFPFLELEAAGMVRRATLFDTVAVYSSGVNAPLSYGMAALIIVIPVVRFASLLYVLGPMALGWYPLRYAAPVFRFAESMRPWAMVEVFLVGVAVALVKVAGLASVSLGPAFWAFSALVVVTVFKDNFMSRVTVWKTLDTRRRS